MWLLIDDFRSLGCDVTCRTSQEGKNALVSYKGNIECLCLDHDLGPGQESGYDVAKWALENGLMPNHVQIVSSNPVGRQNIAFVLTSYGYTTTDGTNFKKV